MLHGEPDPHRGIPLAGPAITEQDGHGVEPK
jgi:hypothetical protein